MSLEKERLDFEREKIAERERRLIEDERRILYALKVAHAENMIDDLREVKDPSD